MKIVISHVLWYSLNGFTNNINVLSALVLFNNNLAGVEWDGGTCANNTIPFDCTSNFGYILDKDKLILAPSNVKYSELCGHSASLIINISHLCVCCVTSYTVWPLVFGTIRSVRIISNLIHFPYIIDKIRWDEWLEIECECDCTFRENVHHYFNIEWTFHIIYYINFHSWHWDIVTLFTLIYICILFPISILYVCLRDGHISIMSSFVCTVTLHKFSVWLLSTKLLINHVSGDASAAHSCTLAGAHTHSTTNKYVCDDETIASLPKNR